MSLIRQSSALLVALSFITLLGTPRELRAQHLEVLVAGHCTAATGGMLLPFVKAFVTISPNALDRSAWRAVSELR